MVGMVLQNGDASLKMLAWSGSMNGFQSTNMIQFLVWNWHPTFWVSAKYSEIRQKVLLMAQILYPVEQESLIPFLKQAFFFEASLMVQWGGFFFWRRWEDRSHFMQQNPEKIMKAWHLEMDFCIWIQVPSKKAAPSRVWSLSCQWLLLMVRLLHLDPFDWWLPPRVSTAEFFQF